MSKGVPNGPMVGNALCFRKRKLKDILNGPRCGYTCDRYKSGCKKALWPSPSTLQERHKRLGGASKKRDEAKVGPMTIPELPIKIWSRSNASWLAVARSLRHTRFKERGAIRMDQ